MSTIPSIQTVHEEDLSAAPIHLTAGDTVRVMCTSPEGEEYVFVTQPISRSQVVDVVSIVQIDGLLGFETGLGVLMGKRQSDDEQMRFLGAK